MLNFFFKLIKIFKFKKTKKCKIRIFIINDHLILNKDNKLYRI